MFSSVSISAAHKGTSSLSQPTSSQLSDELTAQFETFINNQVQDAVMRSSKSLEKQAQALRQAADEDTGDDPDA